MKLSGLIKYPPKSTLPRNVAESVGKPLVTGSADDPSRSYRGYGAARQLWGCRDFEILMDGPAGTGKTRAILELIHFICMKYPKARALLVRKTRESMSESVLVTYEQKVLQANSYLLNGPRRNIRQHYIYNNDSEIILAGMDKPSKIMSTEFDIIGVFEATELRLDEYEMLTTRLRNNRIGPEDNRYHQIVVDCNPGGPSHWLNQRAIKGGMTRLKSRHEDNPLFYDHKTKLWTPQGKRYLQGLDRTTGPRYKRLRLGLWVQAEGMVYDTWDATELHLIPKFNPPAAWPRIRVIDFGYSAPFVCLWMALDRKNDRVYVYRQLYMSSKLVRDHAETILRHSYGERYEATVADWDAEGRADLESCGITTLPAYKEILRGIEATSLRLRPERGKEDGRVLPRLMVMRDTLLERDTSLEEKHQPTCLEEEVESYVWKQDDTGKVIKDMPVGKDDHAMDALRYGIAYFDDLATQFAEVEYDGAEGVAEENTNFLQKRDLARRGISDGTVEITDFDNVRESESPCTVFAHEIPELLGR